MTGVSERCSCGAVFLMVNAGPNETRSAAEAAPESTTCPTCHSLARRYRHRVQAGGVVKMADCPDPWHD